MFYFLKLYAFVANCVRRSSLNCVQISICVCMLVDVEIHSFTEYPAQHALKLEVVDILLLQLKYKYKKALNSTNCL